MEWPIDLRHRPHLSYLSRGGGALPPRQASWVLGPVWCLHWYGYHGALTINGHQLTFAPGDLTLIPPYAVVCYDYGPQPGAHASVQFTGGSAPTAAWVLPALVPAVRAGALIDRLQPCLDDFRDDRRRIEVRIWDCLGDIARPASTEAPPEHGRHVRAALKHIDDHLAAGVNAAETAAAVGVTAGHLNRLFKAEVGTGVGRYIRERRGSLAVHLLLETHRPINHIAADIGLADLQHFNKFIRQLYGCSPRALRSGDPLYRCRGGD